jgi:hypothetical protein
VIGQSANRFSLWLVLKFTVTRFTASAAQPWCTHKRAIGHYEVSLPPLRHALSVILGKGKKKGAPARNEQAFSRLHEFRFKARSKAYFVAGAVPWRAFSAVSRARRLAIVAADESFLFLFFWRRLDFVV